MGSTVSLYLRLWVVRHYKEGVVPERVFQDFLHEVCRYGGCKMLDCSGQWEGQVLQGQHMYLSHTKLGS